MAFDSKKFLDQAGVGHLWSKVKEQVSAINDAADALEARVTTNEGDITSLKAADTDINNKIGTVAENHTVMGDIAAMDTAYKAADTALDGRITANEAAITLLNKTDGTTGSVKKTVDDAIAAVVADAPASLDTLKEISDWISGHADDASAMNSDINALKTKTELGTHEVEGQQVEYATVKDYVEAEIASVTSDATALAGRVTTAEGDIDALETRMGTAESDINALEGLHAANKTVAQEVTDGINALDATVSQTAGTDGLALSISEVDGVITSISGSIAANTYDAHGAAAAVLGASGDAASANTVFGAKAYADDQATAAYNAVIALTNAEIDTAIANAA